MPAKQEDPQNQDQLNTSYSMDSSSSDMSNFRDEEVPDQNVHQEPSGDGIFVSETPRVYEKPAHIVRDGEKRTPVVDFGIEVLDKDLSLESPGSQSFAMMPRSRKCLWVMVVLTVVLILLIVVVLGVMVMSGGSTSSNLEASTVPPVVQATTPAPVHVVTTQAPVTVPTATPTIAPTPSPTLAPVKTEAPTTEILFFIKAKLPDGGQSLDHLNSYQNRALDWVETTHLRGLHNADRILQRYALACIFFATYSVETPYTRQEIGEGLIFGWLRTNLWLQDPDECTWLGITCNEDGKVTEINLAENFLTGMFPQEVVLLKDSLVRLDLFQNYFYNPGDKGNSFLGELHMLQDLNIAQTGFDYDGIPTVIGKLSNLIDLDVSYTLYFGELKPEIFDNLPNLEYLYMGGNSYNSSIPQTFSMLSNLKYFYAEYTDLVGDLALFTYPDSNTELFEVWIDLNPGVSSTLPVEIGNYTQLASLSLTDMDLYGELPTSLGQLVNMEQLWLYGNRFSGQIPSELSILPKLNRLQLENNAFTGQMPLEICQVKLLQGKLKILGSDCDGANPEVDCPSGQNQCCTCCGDECRDISKPLESGGLPVTGIKGDEPSGRSLNDFEARRRQRHLQRRERLERRLKDPDLLKEVVRDKKKRLEFSSRQREFTHKRT